MSAMGWWALAATLLAGALLVVVTRTRARVVRLEARVRGLESRVDDELAPAVGEARGEARAAGVTARRAAVAAGLEETPRRLPLEQLTGPVVRAVAFGAGARRTVARLAGTRAPRRRIDRVA